MWYMPLTSLLATWHVLPDGQRTWADEFRFLGPTNAAIVESIRDRGIEEPIVLGHDGTVLDGLRRLAAAQELGIPVVPFVFRPSPAQTRGTG